MEKCLLQHNYSLRLDYFFIIDARPFGHEDVRTAPGKERQLAYFSDNSAVSDGQISLTHFTFTMYHSAREENGFGPSHLILSILGLKILKTKLLDLDVTLCYRL